MLFLLSVSLFFSCVQDPDCVDAAMGEEISIQVFDTVNYCSENLSITFNAYPNESRCPSDVTCIWAGFVEVELLINQKGKESVLKLSTEPNVSGLPVQAKVGDYAIKLIDVTPYPATNIRIDPDQFRVVLLVEKASS
ncbi:MAG: hypothetical protein P8O16_19455 [Algoriphagus sp.]|uniref:hypothetical protein n=1 Tax=Algoriphagus sp. TaxID=1872435 RepID=UPI002607ADD7|nr:hypothetical protein [Algoriphagus sp.]MDG1279458.1 hypothetical protein [Algoriphagus sp.]